jgi:hypothetical protein
MNDKKKEDAEAEEIARHYEALQRHDETSAMSFQLLNSLIIGGELRTMTDDSVMKHAFELTETFQAERARRAPQPPAGKKERVQ